MCISKTPLVCQKIRSSAKRAQETTYLLLDVLLLLVIHTLEAFLNLFEKIQSFEV